ncbi:hypothetical protein A3F64_01175 [Candidatus Saccharibacteria bacterium RIFCSPHIGHO2_12_FULL_42_8]|nr:MAG: hypothetical protein A3F64_01175 [Candidatus Saccharibacteria bacterium RIFCSPHIGHO2_12_FULL_42_8]
MPKINFFAKDVGWAKIPVALVTGIWLFMFFLSRYDKNGEVETTYMVLLIILGLLYPYLFYVPGQGYLRNLLKSEFLITASAAINILMIKIFYPSHDLLGFFIKDRAGGPGILTLWLVSSAIAPLLLFVAQRQMAVGQRQKDRQALVRAAKVGEVISAIEEETGEPVSPEFAKKIRSLS